MNIYQKSFVAGEIAPSLYGRVDLNKYQSGLRTMRNMLVARHGGAFNRPGSQYCGTVKDTGSTTNPVRLIPFTYDSTTAYAIELGVGYIRFYKDGQLVTRYDRPILGVTKANPAVVTSAYHPFKNGDTVTISGVGGMTQLNGNTYTVTYIDQFSYSINVNSTGFGTYTSGGTAALQFGPQVVELSTGYTADVLFQVKYVQSGNSMILTCPFQLVTELVNGVTAGSVSIPTSWTLTNVLFTPGIAAPTGFALQGGSPGSNGAWQVTAIARDTLEESLPAGPITSSTTVQALQWNAVPGASEYNIYKSLNGIFGFVGVALDTGAPIIYWTDPGYTTSDQIDVTDSPPIARNPFNGAPPSCVTYYQQRLMLGAPVGLPETIYGSRIGAPTNFTLNRPLQDDDSLSFRIRGREYNKVKHMVDLGSLIIFTENGEWGAGGDQGFTPSQINLKQFSYNGANDLAPIVINGDALYVQARGSIVRSLAFQFSTDGYRGNDLTVFSAHLVDGHTLKDWTYQKTPNSIVWAVRDDGVLLGLTYVPEQEVLGWHRHDFFNGTVESVCSVPTAGEDQLYLVVKRTINGQVCRYIERLATRNFTDIKKAVFADCSRTYDGTLTGVTLTLSGGTTWTNGEAITLTASSGIFTLGEISAGNEFHIEDPANPGSFIRFVPSTRTSATVMVGTVNKTVPVGMRNVAMSKVHRAITIMPLLDYLEGQTVSVFADGFVVASPNNPSAAYPTIVVGGLNPSGAIRLPVAHRYITVGLPITADLETLNIDTAQGESVLDKQKLMSKVSLWVEKTRGVWAGGVPPDDDSQDPLEGLMDGFDELKIRYDEGYDQPINLATRVVQINLQAQWNSHGRVFVRQVDPLPMAILAVAPGGLVPFNGGNGG